MHKRCLIITACLFLFISAEGKGACVKPDEAEKSSSLYKTAKQLAVPNRMQRVHRVGKGAVCVSNWGFFGSSFSTYGARTDQKKESLGGCFNPNPDEEVLAPSFEYPSGSNLNYLYMGALWLGAIVPAAKPAPGKSVDTVTSVGSDGWIRIEELYPDGPKPKGAIIERTTRPAVPNSNEAANCISSEAVSEQDIIAVYTDTLTPILSSEAIDEHDQRQHEPIGFQITQKSYSWSYSYAEDFILIDYWIKNISEHPIEKMYMGLYIDGDVYHASEGTNTWAEGARDDICGFKREVYDSGSKKWVKINTAWITDNDGFPETEQGNPPNAFYYKSCNGVTGTRIVRKPPIPPPPNDTLFKESFNWWVGNQSGGESNVDNDWGPWLAKNMDIWESKRAYPDIHTNSRSFPNQGADVLGTPCGDISKYFIMSNGEWDYDQFYAAKDLTSEGWLAPTEASDANGPLKINIANGFDTRYLFSFGPLQTIEPGDSIPLTIAYVAGENFHSKPKNCLNNLGSVYNPEEYERNLNFEDFGLNATWASKVYDNWIDWNGDGIPDSGDGVPDFQGPPPPAAPDLRFDTKNGSVKVKWNGRKTEKSVDDFTRKEDFEGYKIYINKTGSPSDFNLVVTFDRIDYNLYCYKPAVQRWIHVWPSVTIDSLKKWFPGFGDNALAYFDSANYYTYTGSYGKIAVDTITILDTLRIGPVEDDTTFNKFYFTPNDWNQIGLDSFKVYRSQIDSDFVTPEDSEYYEYEYSFSGLLPSQPIYLSVVAFDYGDPQTGLTSLESSKMINFTAVYPLSSAEEVKAKGKKVVIYPNPYRIDGGYADLGFEDPDRTGFREEADRRLWFVNLPSYCKIRIYTLDGDLVREIEHDGRGLVNPTIDYWNLISRNTQAVVSGIYLFSVEDLETGQNQIGKFVIIK